MPYETFIYSIFINDKFDIFRPIICFSVHCTNTIFEFSDQNYILFLVLKPIYLFILKWKCLIINFSTEIITNNTFRFPFVKMFLLCFPQAKL